MSIKRKHRNNTPVQVVMDSKGRKWELFKKVIGYDEPMIWAARPAGSESAFRTVTKNKKSTLEFLSTLEKVGQ